jgi:hypothetical protein
MGTIKICKLKRESAKGADLFFSKQTVIPVQTGIQIFFPCSQHWTPASTGVTKKKAVYSNFLRISSSCGDSRSIRLSLFRTSFLSSGGNCSLFYPEHGLWYPCGTMNLTVK